MRFNLALLIIDIENIVQIFLRYMNVKPNSIFTVAPGFQCGMFSLSFAHLSLGHNSHK